MEPGRPQLVLLRETIDARAYLGCVTDAADGVHRWLEVWVQAPGNSASMPAVVLEKVTNAVLDARWERAVCAMSAADGAALIRTGWETKPPPAVWIDPAARLPTHLPDPQSNEPWILCRDESVLYAAGLPAYGSSLHRYLYQPNFAEASPLIPVVPGSPENLRTRSLESLLNGRGDLLPLNVGGLMFLRTLHPMTLEALFDLLGGRKDAIAADDRLPANLRVRPDTLQDPQGRDGWVFIGQHGKWGRLLEGFHLKLRALAGAVSAARIAVENTTCPLLNLSADSFRVAMGEPAPGLPRLWTSRVMLADGGDALEVQIPASQAKYFLPRPRSGTAIYRPGRASEASRGTGTIRIRKTLPDLADGVVVEGTLATQERLQANPNDLVWLRAAFEDGAVDLYARIEAEPGLAGGEWRFRSVGQRLEQPLTDRIRANEGRPTPANFEILPVLSSPCDLYSLAVLAVRALLVNESAPLPIALDEALSFARQIANQHDPSSPFHLRVRSVFESDRRWLASLGPHRLMWDQAAPEAALDLIPLELWMDTLALIVSMFPGVGPDSSCVDLGAAVQTALHRVFDRAIHDLDTLLMRTRSLIVIDWRDNREVHSIIRGLMTGLSAQTTAVMPSFSDVRLK